MTFRTASDFPFNSARHIQAFHFERMWKVRHTTNSQTLRASLRDNIRGQRNGRSNQHK